MSRQAVKLVTAGSTYGPPNDVEISSRAQALCPFLGDLRSGSALPNVHIPSLIIVLAHLDGDEALTALATSTHDTALLLLFAQTWALAARLGLPIVQNKLISTMEDIYNATLDDRTVYPADANLLKAFNHLVQEVGKDSHAESFLICFVARTTPTTSELEKQLDAQDFAVDVRISLLAEARSFDRDPIKHTPHQFRVDTSHPSSYRPLEARSAVVPVFVSRHTPMPTMHDKRSHSQFLPADGQHKPFQDSLISPEMSPPPAYDNLFDYDAVLSQMEDAPSSVGNFTFKWASIVGREPLRPTVPTTTNLIVMPAVDEDPRPHPALYRVYDPAATAAQNAALGLGVKVPNSAPNSTPTMAPLVPTPDACSPRMPEVKEAAHNNPRDVTTTGARSAIIASAQTEPASPPIVPALSRPAQPVNAAPAPTRTVQPADAAPSRQPSSSPDRSEAAPRPPRRSEAVPGPETDTRAPQNVLHCCEFRPAKQRNWVSRIVHGWRCPGAPCPQHECGHHPRIINQTTSCAGATNCGRYHCRLPAEGIIINTRSHHGRTSHRDGDGDGDGGSPSPSRSRQRRSPSPEPRHVRPPPTSRNDTIDVRTHDHDTRVPRSTRRSRRDDRGRRDERTQRGRRHHTSHNSSDETIAWWRPKKTGEKTKFHLVSYERQRWDE